MSQVGYGPQDPIASPFDKAIPLTGATVTPLSSLAVINPAGTLAALTVQFPLNPAEGQRLAIVSTAAVTALTLTAGTNDTINGAASALAVNVGIEYAYTLSGIVNAAGVNARTWFKIR
jgi:hypothetical protein